LTVALALAPRTGAGDDAAPASAWLDRWPSPSWLLALLVLGAVAYFVGAVRLRRLAAVRPAIGGQQMACYAGCFLTLLIALGSPLAPLSDLLFSAHMTQHELLMIVAAPLLVLARPLVPVLWALPPRIRLRAAATLRTPAVRAVWRRLTGPVSVWLLHGAALWVFHLPFLFEAALRHDALHAFQHACFFWTAVLFWWAVVHGRYGRGGYGLAVVFVFTTSLHSGALGALLTWSSAVWYGTYARTAPAWGALEDQQLAGLIMWVPAGAVCLVVGLALFAAWVGESERRVRYGATEALIAEAREAASRAAR
jgi:putative membrane protein